MYSCRIDDLKYGCPKDFFQDCSTFIKFIEYIKRQNFNDMEYRKDMKFIYVSGCSEENDGRVCIEEKVRFQIF